LRQNYNKKGQIAWFVTSFSTGKKDAGVALHLVEQVSKAAY